MLPGPVFPLTARTNRAAVWAPHADHPVCEHPLVRKVVTDEPALVAELLAPIPVLASSIRAS